MILLKQGVIGQDKTFQQAGSKLKTTTEKKLTGVEPVEKVDPEPIVPEYEDDETEAKTRQEKKIDPLVVDVERNPIDENTDGEPKDPSEQEVEGRFFLKDKLCALGLADVSS